MLPSAAMFLMSRFLQRDGVRWGRALRAIRDMRRDPSRTELIFELNVALAGKDYERQYEFFLREPGAAALMAERPSLVDALSDFDGLRALPPETLGRHYVRLMDRNGLAADGLKRESEKILEFRELSPGEDRSWFTQRVHCVHDLLHVVTGYGQDPAGEAALLAFYDGWNCQRRRMRVVRFGMISSVLCAPWSSRLRAIRFSAEARRRGVRARIPLSFRWEGALSRSIEEVRRGLEVTPPERAHPSGILEGDLVEPWRPQRIGGSA